MPQSVLNHFDIDACFAQSGCERMPQTMTTEMWKHQSILFAFQHDLIIAVADDPAKSLIKSALMLWLPKAINKDEVRVSINSSLSLDTSIITQILVMCKFS